jgi:hypothetical protein
LEDKDSGKLPKEAGNERRVKVCSTVEYRECFALIADVLGASLDEGPGNIIIPVVEVNRDYVVREHQTLDSVLDVSEDFPKRPLALEAALGDLLGREPFETELLNTATDFHVMVRLVMVVAGGLWRLRRLLNALWRSQLRSPCRMLKMIGKSSLVR